jgi:hypothetical protein
MAYIQVEASVRTHKKFLKVGPAASWLWLCGVGYCQDGLTDGFIPAEALKYLGVKAPSSLKDQLVAVGLWDEAPGGWLVHDYLQHNKSAAAVADVKHSKRAAGAAGGRASGEARREAHSEAGASAGAEAPIEPPREPISSHLCSTHLISSQLGSSTDSSEPSNGSKPAASNGFVIEFSTVGKGAKTWGLTLEQIESWRSAYPGVDVEGECRKALAWTEANHRKTASGMPRFLVSWLNRVVDRGRNGFVVSPSPSKALPKWALEAQARKANGQ